MSVEVTNSNWSSLSLPISLSPGSRFFPKTRIHAVGMNSCGMPSEEKDGYFDLLPRLFQLPGPFSRSSPPPLLLFLLLLLLLFLLSSSTDELFQLRVFSPLLFV